jgi:hypothetical protein
MGGLGLDAAGERSKHHLCKRMRSAVMFTCWQYGACVRPRAAESSSKDPTEQAAASSSKDPVSVTKLQPTSLYGLCRYCDFVTQKLQRHPAYICYFEGLTAHGPPIDH